MKNPVTSVKEKVSKHKTKIVFGTGVVTGVTGIVLLRQIAPMHILAPIDSETLQRLINDEGIASYIDPASRVKFSLFNAAHLEKLK